MRLAGFLRVLQAEERVRFFTDIGEKEMFARISFEKAEKKQIVSFLETMEEINRNNRGSLILKSRNAAVRIRPASIRKHSQMFDFFFNEDSYPALIRWCRDFSLNLDQGRVVFLVLVRDEEKSFLDKFWISQGTVKLVGSISAKGEITDSLKDRMLARLS